MITLNGFFYLLIVFGVVMSIIAFGAIFIVQHYESRKKSLVKHP
ncbi:MAG: hypothetical protein ABIJ30_03595 [bacterium]